MTAPLQPMPRRPLAQRDGLTEDEEREHHGEDGHGGGDDAGIDGRGEAQSYGVETLVTHDAQYGRPGKEQDVAHRHMLSLGKERGHPEQQGGTCHTERHQRDAVDAMCHGILAQGCHEPPDGLGREHAGMGHQWFIVVHIGNDL
jgi:hypothetical protein